MGLLLVAYDIRDDARRDRVARTLLHRGRRVQYSVFLVHRGTAEEIAVAIAPLLDHAEDDVRIHPLCAGCEGRVHLLGRATQTATPATYRIV